MEFKPQHSPCTFFREIYIQYLNLVHKRPYCMSLGKLTFFKIYRIIWHSMHFGVVSLITDSMHQNAWELNICFVKSLILINIMFNEFHYSPKPLRFWYSLHWILGWPVTLIGFFFCWEIVNEKQSKFLFIMLFFLPLH